MGNSVSVWARVPAHAQHTSRARVCREGVGGRSENSPSRHEMAYAEGNAHRPQACTLMASECGFNELYSVHWRFAVF